MTSSKLTSHTCTLADWNRADVTWVHQNSLPWLTRRCSRAGVGGQHLTASRRFRRIERCICDPAPAKSRAARARRSRSPARAFECQGVVAELRGRAAAARCARASDLSVCETVRPLPHSPPLVLRARALSRCSSRADTAARSHRQACSVAAAVSVRGYTRGALCACPTTPRLSARVCEALLHQPCFDTVVTWACSSRCSAARPPTTPCSQMLPAGCGM